MAQSSTYLRSQIGVEGTPGTAVAANKRFRLTDLTVKPEIDTDVRRRQGDAYDTSAVMSKNECTVDFEGALTYDEAGYIFSSAYGSPATTETETDATWSHVWTPPVAAAPSDRMHFTVQHGAGTTVNEAAGCAVASFEYSASKGGGEGKVDFKGSMVGGKVTATTFTASPTATSASQVAPLKIAVRFDDAWADVPTATVTTSVQAVEYKREGLAVNYSLANGTDTPAGTVVGETKAEFTFTLMDGSEATALVANLQSEVNAVHYVHVGVVGPHTAGGTEDFEFGHRACIRVTGVTEIKGLDDTNIGYEITATVVADSAGHAETITLVNGVETY